MSYRRPRDEYIFGLSEKLAQPLRGTIASPLAGRRLGAAYVGPLDLISSGTLLQAVSTRRQLRAAYTGPMARLRESGGNTEQDFSPASGLWSAAAAATFIGANSGFYTKLYDQSGNGHDPIMATSAHQPGYAEAGLAGGAAASFDGTDDALFREFPSTINATDLWSLTVAIRSTAVQYHGLIGWGTNGQPAWNSANGGEVFINTGLGANGYQFNTAGSSRNNPMPTVDVPYYTTVRTTTGKIIGVNGTEYAAIGSGSWAIDRMTLGGRCGASAGNPTGNNWIGYIAESYTFTSEPSADDRAALIADVVAFYGLS